jgi:hypothetical protein
VEVKVVQLAMSLEQTALEQVVQVAVVVLSQAD